MRRALVTALAVLLAVSVGMSTRTIAQPKTQPAPNDQLQPPPSKMDQKSGTDRMEQTVTGKIKSVSGAMVMLEDGTTLTVPKTVKVSRAELKKGAMITAHYEQKGSQKVVTSIEVTKG